MLFNNNPYNPREVAYIKDIILTNALFIITKYKRNELFVFLHPLLKIKSEIKVCDLYDIFNNTISFYEDKDRAYFINKILEWISLKVKEETGEQITSSVLFEFFQLGKDDFIYSKETVTLKKNVYLSIISLFKTALKAREWERNTFLISRHFYDNTDWLEKDKEIIKILNWLITKYSPNQLVFIYDGFFTVAIHSNNEVTVIYLDDVYEEIFNKDFNYLSKLWYHARSTYNCLSEDKVSVSNRISHGMKNYISKDYSNMYITKKRLMSNKYTNKIVDAIEIDIYYSLTDEYIALDFAPLK